MTVSKKASFQDVSNGNLGESEAQGGWHWIRLLGFAGCDTIITVVNRETRMCLFKC